MVERLFRVFHREWGGLHEAAFLLAGTALVSQVLGLARDRLLAHHFGAGTTLDVYYASFRVPDFLYASVASFVAVTVLIPFLLQKFNEENPSHHVQKFVNSVFTVFFAVIVLACAVSYLVIPALSHYVVPGFSGDERSQFILLSRVLLLSPLLLGISNLFGAVTQSLRRFFVFAAGPILYNMGIITGILFFMPHLGLLGVCLGVCLGALLHVLIQLPVLIREKMLPRFTFRVEWKEILRVTQLSIPRTISLSASHLATIGLIALASRDEGGSIAVFTLAMNLQSIPLSIVGMSYSVAAFPTLAKMWTGGNKEEFSTQILSATRHIMFWSFPAITLFIVLRAQIVRTFLGSGAFDWSATRLTAAALALFVISVVAQNIVLLYTRAFYAMGKTKVPLVANAIGAIVIIGATMTLLFVFHTFNTFRFFAETLLRVDGIAGTSVLMLPLGYSIGMMINVCLLFRALRGVYPHVLSGVKRAFLHSFTVSILMGFVAYHGLQVFDNIFDVSTFVGILLQGLCSGIAGIIAGIFLLRLLNSAELEEIRSSLHHKFWRSKPIANEQEVL